MNPQERLQFEQMQRDIADWKQYKQERQRQQISYPLDEVSRTIINQDTSSGFTVLGTSSVVTIASGTITVTESYHEVDTEGAAATDDLDTISTDGISNGSVLVLQPASTLRTVVCKDGTGNLRLAGDFSMDGNHDTITLIKDTSFWYELSRSDNN